MQTQFNRVTPVITDLTGIRVMGAPAKPNQYQRLAARVAQRMRLDLPPIQA